MDDKTVSLEQLKLNYASLGKKTRLGQEMFMLNDRNRNYQRWEAHKHTQKFIAKEKKAKRSTTILFTHTLNFAFNQIILPQLFNLLMGVLGFWGFGVLRGLKGF